MTPSALPENRGLAFRGVEPRGRFGLEEAEAQRLLAKRNPHGKPNSDVVRPWVGAADLSRARARRWIIDFPSGMEVREAALYEAPFALVRRRVRPVWAGRRAVWWTHGRPRPEMRIALAKRERYVATPWSGSPRLFAWMPVDALPVQSLAVFARDDDWFLGVLHSRLWAAWSRRGETAGPAGDCATFPFPWPPATPLGKLTRAQDQQRSAIAEAAGALDRGRRAWLEQRHETPLTLAGLCRLRPPWLDALHRQLDDAVTAAYGWPPDLSDAEIVALLLTLNQERALRP